MHIPDLLSVMGEECEGLVSLPEGAEASLRDAQLEQGWQDFNAGLEPDSVRPAIRRSWQASREAAIDPGAVNYVFPAEAELKAILQKQAELIEVAGSIMQSLLAYNPDGHINLTDADGVTLCYCGLDMTPVGSILRESVMGTNCTGRCLNEQRLVYLLSGENWKQELRQRHRQCAAAPVRNAEGRMIGVLTLTASQDNFHYHTLGTVQAAAEAIGRQLVLRSLLAEQRSILETLNEGVIVTDASGTIKTINRYARQIFRGLQLTGRDLDKALLPEGLRLTDITFCNDREVIFQPPDRPRVACLVSVMPAPDGGRIVSLRDNQRIRAITRQVMGIGASYTFEMICGRSPALTEALEKARTSSRSDSTVLLTGESGTGKELFAQAIHNGSDRQGGPFIAVNCAALPRDLVQSELFGYVDGAFTGSRRGGAAGKFELAEGGTLFLDEIGDMPLEAQTSLLRVLQEAEVMRIGAQRPVKVDVRIIAATNCDLLRAMETGAFRRDLFYRLNVLSLRIPALRERTGDVPQLVEWFSEKMCTRLKKASVQFTSGAMAALSCYPWPGNVRELENIVERAINLSDKQLIHAEDLPEEIGSSPEQCDPQRLESSERAHIISVLSSLKGNLRRTAQTIGVSRAGLYNKLKKHGISVDEFRG
ncbi:sigma 54-interacting transcriptional regulator [Erwinia sp. MMLR14_017]|uniref:sigma-54-dependent Fis family transcriptional regulator n=1 Tax=Erwinia sp. MMLR14_017 TaxID=3093842 RepID=UPI0029900041|nr:sigma 54-interacting transcriptional regulator [Erwinia sp. MMLR14_017]MDW8844663.1 sigma 54-interacting transcriptional regulator [Erwinia sp. MMLR14_017]